MRGEGGGIHVERFSEYCHSDSKALRIEKLPQGWFEYNKAFSTVSEFYGRKTESDAEAEECCDTLEKAEGNAVMACRMYYSCD